MGRYLGSARTESAGPVVTFFQHRTPTTGTKHLDVYEDCLFWSSRWVKQGKMAYTSIKDRVCNTDTPRGSVSVLRFGEVAPKCLPKSLVKKKEDCVKVVLM